MRAYAAHEGCRTHHRHVTILGTIRAVRRGGATGWGMLLMDRAVVGFHTSQGAGGTMGWVLVHARQGAGGTMGWVCRGGLGSCCECRGVHQRSYGYSVRAWTGLVCERLRSEWVCEGICLQP